MGGGLEFGRVEAVLVGDDAAVVVVVVDGLGAGGTGVASDGL